MGTRNLTLVVSNEKTKVAQYGQWDGYLGGQGLTILNFLKNCNLEKFKEQVNGLSFFTQKQLDNLGDDWLEKYPYLSRDIGGKILAIIHYGKYEDETISYNGNSVTTTKTETIYKIGKLVNRETFANDSLFCEYAYVIDLDKNTFEIYKGFNTEPISKDERFYKAKPDENGYYPIRIIKSYDLNNLPTEEEFLGLDQEEE